jgi:hypothetical protein
MVEFTFEKITAFKLNPFSARRSTMEDKDSIVLNKPKKGEKHPCLESKRALKALHQKCLEYVAQRNVSYIDQPILTELLGGSDEVKPNVVAEIMTYMVSMVWISWCIADGRTWSSWSWVRKIP